MFQDLKRARYKLGRGYDYASSGRSNFAILLQSGQQNNKESERQRCFSCSAQNCWANHGACHHVGHPINPVNVLRNRSTLKVSAPFEIHTGSNCCKECHHPVYDFLGDCFNLTFLSSKPSQQLRAWVRDIIGILKDADLLEKLFQIISPKENCLHADFKASSGPEVGEKDSNNDLSAGCISNSENKDFDVLDPGEDHCIDEDLLSFSFDEDSKKETSYEFDDDCKKEANPWLKDDWHTRNDQCLCKKLDDNWSLDSKETTNDSLVFENDNAQNSWDVGTEPSIYLTDNSEYHVSTVDSEECFVFSCISDSTPSVSPDNDNELPCLNHNTSLTSMPDAENGSYVCDPFPVDEMSPLCAVRKVGDCGSDLSLDVPMKDCSEQKKFCGNGLSGDRDMDDIQNCIDPISDTYTLPGFPLTKRNKFYQEADDGAQGDGIHFNLGIHPTWWCQGNISSRDGVGVFPIPSPQDRLARITYKTQPSDATYADAPMFVFSSVGGAKNRNVPTTRMIPLDFNLNAIYKTAPREERGAGDNTLATEADANLSLSPRGTPEGSTNIEEPKSSVQEEATDGFQSVRSRDDVWNRNTLQDRKYFAGFTSNTFGSMLTSGQPYILYVILTLSAVILSSCIPSYWSCESVFTLFWGILVHASLVGVLLLLLFVCLEANNLTEHVVKKLQLLVKRTLATPSSRELLMANDQVVEAAKKFQANHQSKINPLVIQPSDTNPEACSGGSSDDAIKETLKSIIAFEMKPAESSLGANTNETVQENFSSKPVSMATAVRETKDCISHEIIESRNSIVSPIELIQDKQQPGIECSELPSAAAGSSNDVFIDQKNQENDQSCQPKKAASRIYVEMSTMTDFVASKECGGSASSSHSVAQTMTETTNFQSSSTQTENTIVDDKSESTFQIVEIWPEAASVETANASVQAEMDAKRIYQQTEKLKLKQEHALQRLQKKFLAVRRRCQKEALEMKQLDRRKNECLSKLQLSLPNLQKERFSLMAERASIDKQFEDEKKKNRELVSRLTRLNQQFYRLGQVQQQPPPPHLQWRQQYQHQTYQVPTHRPQCDPTIHLNTLKPGHSSSPHQQTTLTPPQHQLQQKMQQSTLLQNQVRGNSNPNPSPGQQPCQQQPCQQPGQLQMQQQQQQQMIQQQQQQLLHQQRLPIFQLFNKSFCQPHPDGLQQVHGQPAQVHGQPPQVQMQQQGQGQQPCHGMIQGHVQQQPQPQQQLPPQQQSQQLPPRNKLPH
ncbi:hypothetical protein BgiMline_000601 [Biomphalaria glabrata]|nr:protein suppressor 2 of zeste-like isoform X2 [Biomphalaria glabrata]